MKVKHVINDLGPKTLVQIYTPSNTGHIERCFAEAYTVEVLIGVQGIDVLGKYLDRDIDHVEYGHYYNVTDDMVASCNIYLKAEQAVKEEKPDTNTAIYADLEKKWGVFCNQLGIDGDFDIRACHIGMFLHSLSEGYLTEEYLNEKEDKDLS